MRNDWNLENYRHKNPFSVPEGYFESLTARVMDNLPEQKKAPAKQTRLAALRPYWYVAAAFVGFIICCGSLLQISSSVQQRDLALQDSIYMEDMMNYTMMNNLDIQQYLTDASGDY